MIPEMMPQMSTKSSAKPSWRVAHSQWQGTPSIATYYDYAAMTPQLSTASELRLGESWEDLRKRGSSPDTFLGRLVLHHKFETFGGLVVLVNFVTMTMETHATATDDANVLRFVKIANLLLLIYYTVEFLLRLCVLRKSFFKSAWNFLDFVIVFTGWVSELLEAFEMTSGMDKIALLKCLRMLRLLRLVRLFVAFRELYVLVAGIGRCMKTLFWASGLIFIVLNVWAILSVEFLDQKVKELVPLGLYRTCSWCPNAFSNIWYANLTWFHIISTADWTTIGRPLAEEFSWPYAFFVFNIFTVVWGLVNLIVAAIVDANIAGRVDNVAFAAHADEKAYQQAWQSFERICREMDSDGSGDVSVKEFKDFLKESVELQHHLKTMGIQEHDVTDLLTFADDDGSGTLECNEFIEQFTTMRTLVEKTSLYFLLRYNQSIQEKVCQQSQEIRSLQSDIATVKSLCRKIQTSELKGSAPGSANSLPSPAAAPKDSQTSNGQSVAAPGALKTTTPTLRSAAQFEIPRVDMKRLPPGWYYFGASLPPEASVWCKAVDESDGVTRTRDLEVPMTTEPKKIKISDDGVMCSRDDDQRWEPLPSNTAHAHHAKHVYVKAPIGDIQLPHEIIKALAAVDKSIDSVYSDPGTKEVPVTADGQRWEALLSNGICVYQSKYVYVKAPIGDVNYPPAIIEAVASIDRFFDRTDTEPSASTDELAKKHDPVCDLLDAIDNDSSTFLP